MAHWFFQEALCAGVKFPEQTVIREGKRNRFTTSPYAHTWLLPKPTKCIDCMSVIHIAYQAEVIGGELRKSIEGQPSWANEEDLLDKLSPYYLTIFQITFGIVSSGVGQAFTKHDNLSVAYHAKRTDF